MSLGFCQKILPNVLGLRLFGGKMSKKEVSLTKRIDKGKVIDYLEGLINGLKSDTVCLQSGDGLVTLKPSSIIEFELEAVAKKDKEKVKIELSWAVEKDTNEKEFSITPIESSKTEVEIV